MHEQSETVQDPRTGEWVNVFGRGTANAYSPLPGMSRYSTAGAADAAAAARSRSFHGSEAPLDVQRYWERSYSAPIPEGKMPGLSSYRFQGLSPRPEDAADPRSPMLANNVLGDHDNANLDEMLRRLDSGQVAPGNLGETRGAMPTPDAQAQNPWLEYLMQYLRGNRPTSPGTAAPRQ